MAELPTPSGADTDETGTQYGRIVLTRQVPPTANSDTFSAARNALVSLCGPEDWDVLARLLFIILGTIFLLIGILGVVLPLLPATPFLLLASACYVRGSHALHSWLMSHTYVGTYLSNIQEHRGMPRKAKIMTIAVLWVSLLFSMYRAESLLLDAILLMVGIGVTALICRLKTVE